MEDRREMFQGTYMDRDQRYIHLGVDINVPAGTAVTFPLPCRVLRITHSPDTDVGWGTRIDLGAADFPLVFLLGHLGPGVSVGEGEILNDPQRIIGHVGTPEVNGGVDAHTHLQAVDRSLYHALVDTDLDGYGRREEIEDLRWQYPEPLNAVLRLLR